MRLKPAFLYALWHTASAFALPATPGRSRRHLARRHASTIGPEAPSNEKPGPKPPPLATIPPPTPSTPRPLRSLFAPSRRCRAPASASSARRWRPRSRARLDPVRVAVVLGRTAHKRTTASPVGSLGRHSDRVGRKPCCWQHPRDHYCEVIGGLSPTFRAVEPLSLLRGARLLARFSSVSRRCVRRRRDAHAVLGSRIQAHGSRYAVVGRRTAGATSD